MLIAGWAGELVGNVKFLRKLTLKIMYYTHVMLFFFYTKSTDVHIKLNQKKWESEYHITNDT